VAADYIVKVGDRPGPLQIDCTYSDGTSPSFDGTETIGFRMRAWETDPAVVTGAGRVVDTDTLAYDWLDADFGSRAPGMYQAEFHVTRGDGRKETFPANEAQPYIRIWLQAAIATA